ncbi:cytochrome P450 [Rhizoclosmatium globosum]|uniref:Cytochrome P450 n=1 Tax=Rhizoclosmatium globosum TaxID=329046 RepID=A0A1Y2B789_9FUNG|nr:cytochrome P450 [Rhizoclosmatium globosum]|eukprot:ORY30708.1 cytochrome P450 [Rhizoclosmatium globosum]
MNWLLRNKFALFENRHNQMYARCTSDTTTVFIAEPALIREVLHRNKEFVKPVHMYGVLRFFGDNLVSTEGVDWKRHRKIVAPAFSEQNNILVHAASTRIAQEMFASWDRNKTGPRVQVSKDMTKFALAIISSAGFGIEFAWHDMNDKNVWHGHSLSFKNALEIVVQRAVAFAVMPKALKMLPFKWMKDTKKGYDEFNQYLDELLDREVPERPKNIVEMLLKASQEDSSAGLTRQELKGNAFVLIFAGHETTANTLSYALALLAIHQDKQESLYKESINVLEESQAPEYSDISKLTYALAVMNETLRHFPQPSTIPKYTADKTLILGDTVLPPKTVLSFATAALHMHTDIWGPDASEFKPERWNEKKESMLGFLPFSEGPRACLGKRFAQIEFITLLTMISVRYKWYVPDGVAEKELLESGTLLTTYPLKPIELIFTHRSV